MAADGFSVDIDALKDAGLGLADLLAMMDEVRGDNIDCAPDALGHGTLSEAYASFTDRWRLGLGYLTEDGNELSRRLIDTAGNYLEVDQQVMRDLQAILDAFGAAPRDV
ncbi:hypothetical protein OU415_23700 [Saccharopolyspora sp. WRP15-2]|uniref:Excreted virulence factor EspC (Type VII ESX diderm) n=1 Tax=Saccharopolyspora oryzae TaxID=2997343 RepID=A0ABT4V576_9PSEU|nr:hypothetical protein [Saccharopolyspora oryzae]MDA3628457.1 hypothetical protein [Saccharopolyspora oryzae]